MRVFRVLAAFTFSAPALAAYVIPGNDTVYLDSVSKACPIAYTSGPINPGQTSMSWLGRQVSENWINQRAVLQMYDAQLTGQKPTCSPTMFPEGLG